MTAYIALLYSVVLGPGRRVVMADLRAMAADLGLQEPRTLVATGNLLFSAEGTTPAGLEARLEPAFERSFGRHVDIIVRRAAGWRKLVAGNPFPDESRSEARFVNVRVMRDPLGPDAVERLAPYAVGGERLQVVDGDLWIYFAHGVGQSKLAAAMTPKRLGVGTSRNWNTVRRLGEMLG